MLIAMAGLPGSGKSTIAGLVGARLRAAVLSVDPIESAILSAGIGSDQPTGLAAYLVAETMAESVLAGRQSIIVDAVNAVDAAREQWVQLAERRGVPLRFIELTCSDPELQKTRLEARMRSHPHLSEPNWHAVEQTLDEWDEWEGASAAAPRLVLDTSDPLEANVDAAVAFLQA